MESLYNQDPSMWLFQISRFAAGQMPYRDFSWNYPPLAIFLLGSIARWFGATFAVVQIAMDLISLAVVFLCVWLVRYLLEASTRFVTVAAVIAVCATSFTKFNLFSFSTYSPALEIAAAALLMLLIGGLRQLERGDASPGNLLLLCAGVFVATVSKPEAAVAAWGAVVLLRVLDKSAKWRWYLLLVAGAGIPAAAFYAFVGITAGFPQLKAGLGGYGLASFACPWWPTGYGVFGMVAETGEAAFVAAVLLWLVRSRLEPRCRSVLGRLSICGCTGLLIFVSYVWYQSGYVLLSSAPGSVKLETLARAVVWTNGALLPVMWASIFVWIGFVFSFRKLGGASPRLCFFLSVPVIMSGRGLFGTTLFPYTEVSAMCYPFFVIAAACLLEALYRRALPQGRVASTLVISILLGGYGAARLIGAYPAQLSDEPYYTLHTKAGDIRLSDDHVSERIYDYVLSHTHAGDMLLDVPYGGGFNFATGLPSPTFTTQFQQLRMSMSFQDRDLNNVLKTPPALVVADPGPNFQAQFGYPGKMNCPFPRLVWEPTDSSWSPGYAFPVITYVAEHYHQVAEYGQKVILAPNSPAIE